ncbi:CbrC family protein [Stenotrophomonas sp. CD2]|nr:CbrC family protein [Stenotrophomonas sp. CD2]
MRAHPGLLVRQQSVWLSHCERPCAFLGYAGSEDLQPILDEVRPDVVEVNPRDADWVLEHLSRDGEMIGCLFQCRNAASTAFMWIWGSPVQVALWPAGCPATPSAP